MNGTPARDLAALRLAVVFQTQCLTEAAENWSVVARMH